MINKMPGEYEQKFASYRAFLAYMMAHPGKKLLFMGQEFGQMKEWDYKSQLDWNLMDFDSHRDLLKFSEKLNKFYIENPPLWQNDDSWNGFSWISNDDYKQSIISFRRIDDNGDEIIAVCNFVPVERREYRIGVPQKGRYKLIFNTDAAEFGGSGITESSFKSDSVPMHGHDNSISMTLAPLSVIYLKFAPVKRRTTSAKDETKAAKKPAAKKTAAKTEAAPKAKTTAKKTAAKADEAPKAKPAAKKTAAKKPAAKTSAGAKKTKTSAKKTPSAKDK
jgi:1,4-alpha-glucan branching enzyme